MLLDWVSFLIFVFIIITTQYISLLEWLLFKSFVSSKISIKNCIIAADPINYLYLERLNQNWKSDPTEIWKKIYKIFTSENLYNLL